MDSTEFVSSRLKTHIYRMHGVHLLYMRTRTFCTHTHTHLANGFLVQVPDHDARDPAGDPELHGVVDARPVVRLVRGGVLRHVPESYGVVCQPQKNHEGVGARGWDEEGEWG